MKSIFYLLSLILLMSCNKDDGGTNNVFQFNLSNSYLVEATGVKYETPNGFEATNLSNFTMLLSDGDIDDELSFPCCSSAHFTQSNLVFLNF